MAPFLKVFDIVPGWLYAAAVALLLVGLGGLEAARRVQVAGLEAKLAQAQTAHAKDREQAFEAHAALEKKYRAIEAERNRLAMENADAIAKEKSATAAALAAGRDADRRVRSAIAEYARPRGGAPGDPQTLARAEQRAETLGGLLETCRGEATEDAGELEELATQVRGLQRAYIALDPGTDSR